jgi:alpha-glucosidase
VQPYGFTAAGVEPWLPQPDGWGTLSVAAQDADPGSMLSLYRMALRLRSGGEAGLRGEEFGWLPSAAGVLAFHRSNGFSCVVNLSGEPLPLPEAGTLLLASDVLSNGLLPPDTAAWLRSAQ